MYIVKVTIRKKKKNRNLLYISSREHQADQSYTYNIRNSVKNLRIFNEKKKCLEKEQTTFHRAKYKNSCVLRMIMLTKRRRKIHLVVKLYASCRSEGVLLIHPCSPARRSLILIKSYQRFVQIAFTVLWQQK